MIGLRVVDVGLLVAFLVWFFRLRDDDDDSRGDAGGGREGPDPRPGRHGPGGDGIGLPLGRYRLGRGRDRSHGGPRRPARRRGQEPPLRRPLPSRVRRPRSPVPTHRT